MKQESLSESLIKLILIVSAIVTLGSFAGSIAYLSQMPYVDPTAYNPTVPAPTAVPQKQKVAEWNAYQSSNMGFSVKYPSDWTVSNEAMLSTGTEVNFVKDNNTKLSIRSGARYSQELGREYTVAEWVDSVKNNIREYSTSVDEEKITIDNIPAIKLVHKNLQGNNVFEIYTEKDKNLYEISLTSASMDYNIYKPVLDEIITSFKFTDDQSAAKKTISEEIITSLGGYTYKLETVGNYADADWDQRIIRMDKAGKGLVVLPSVKKALPELKERFNLVLTKFSVPENSTLVFFKSVLMETDNPGGAIYSFDISTNKLKKLKINEIYNGFFGGFAFSPGKTVFIWIPQPTDNGDDKEMYLIDLASDEYKLLVTLKGNETFNGGRGAMSARQDVEWLSATKIKYAVYDQSKKTKSYDPYSKSDVEKILIEYRQLTVK